MSTRGDDVENGIGGGDIPLDPADEGLSAEDVQIGGKKYKKPKLFNRPRSGSLSDSSTNDDENWDLSPDVEGESGQMLPQESTSEDVYVAFEKALKAENTDPDIHVAKRNDNFYAYREDPSVAGGKLVLAQASVPSKGQVSFILNKDIFKPENIHLVGGLASFAAGREFNVKCNDINQVNALIKSFGKESLIFDDTDPRKNAYNEELAKIDGIRLLSKEDKPKSSPRGPH